MILLMFGVFGGGLAFGLVGLFIGPTVVALGYTLLQEWAPSSVAAAAVGANAAVVADDSVQPQPVDARETRIA